MILLKDRLKELEGLIDRLADARHDAGYYVNIGGGIYYNAVNEAIQKRVEISKLIREIQTEYEVLDNA